MELTRGVVIVWLAWLLVLAGGCGDDGTGAPQGDAAELAERATGHCLDCHRGIETAHAGFPLGCTQCHGGDPAAETEESAHIQPAAPLPQDATTLPEDYFDTPYLRFLNPTNLRVVRNTCGQSGIAGASCHASYVDDLMKSMMATTSGHLTGGGYQSGILPDRSAQWGNLPVDDIDGEVPEERGALARLAQVPSSDAFSTLPMTAYERHYADVPRKICARCHLWSRGAAVRGVTGQEGNYRSEGCAACHMPYTNAALSESADPTVDKREPGHPRLHEITRRIPTDQCTHCHIRGARIGLSFRGLAQTPPGTATGPNYPGLTPEKIHGAYYQQNPAVNPPDVHHERGMHCIDCHVRREIMGDGNIYGHMDQATEIECTDCHGTPSAYGSMRTGRGTPLTHLAWENGRMILTSKVTGEKHVVPQVKDVVDPLHPRFNALAALAMNENHLKDEGGLECYTCHSAWQSNCFGCHFNRDLGKSALDMLSGQQTAGKPVTDDKYFVNFKNFHMGYNAEGKVAPYLVGCQVLATVVDADGRKVLDQELPVTASGLSGLAMNPEHPHTNRKTARSCTECHRNPAALGLGTDGFDLSRTYLFVLDGGSLAVIDRRIPAQAHVVASLPVTEPRSLHVRTDQIRGRATVAYVATAAGLTTISLDDPAQPGVAAIDAAPDARAVASAGGTLYLAAAEGVVAYDIGKPLRPRRMSTAVTVDARALAVHGLHLLVADGAGGLAILEVRDPTAPHEVARLDLNGASSAPNRAIDVVTLPDYSDPPSSGLKPFNMIAYVADGGAVRIVNINEPTSPSVIGTIAVSDARALAAKSHFDPGSSTVPSLEHEYLFVADAGAGLRIFDVSDPATPKTVTVVDSLGPVYDVLVVNAFAPPHNKEYAYIALGTGGLAILDTSAISAPVTLRSLPVEVESGIDLERVQLDRFVDEDGTQIKDTSHEGARPFTRAEIERILEVSF